MSNIQVREFKKFLKTVPKLETFIKLFKKNYAVADEQGNSCRFYVSNEYNMYHLEDGMGNECSLFFLPNGHALFTVYDHENELNFFDNQYDKQTVWNDVPKEFQFILDEKLLVWSWDKTGHSWSTGAIIFDGKQWNAINKDFLQQITEIDNDTFGGLPEWVRSIESVVEDE